MTEAFKQGFLDTLEKIAQEVIPGQYGPRVDPADVVEKPVLLKEVPETAVPKWHSLVPWKTLDEKTRDSERAFNKGIRGRNYNKNMYYKDDVLKARALAAAGRNPSEYKKHHGSSLSDFAGLTGLSAGLIRSGADPNSL